MKQEKAKNKKPLYIFLHLPKNGGTSFVANLKKKVNKENISGAKKIKNISDKEKSKIKFIIGHVTYYGIHKYFPNRETRYIVFIRNPAERRVSQYNHDIARLQENKTKKYKKLPSFKKWYKSQITDEQCFLLNKKFKGIPGRKAPNFTNNFITKFNVGNNKFLKMLGFKLLKIIYKKRNKKQEFENAKKLIKKSWFATTTDKLDKDLPRLFKKMNLPQDWEHYRTAKNKGEKTNKAKLEVKKTFQLDKKTREKIYKENPFDLKFYENVKELNKIN
jgi:hypothetical protein